VNALVNPPSEEKNTVLTNWVE